MQNKFSTEEKRLTNLHEYAKRCKRVYQDIKDIAYTIAAAEQYKRASTTILNIIPAKKVATTSTTTTRTTSQATSQNCSRQLTASERD